MADVPARAEAIDPAWLTRALSARHPGVRVAAVEIAQRAEVTNAHAWLRVRYDEAAGAPESLFCKLLPNDPTRRSAIAATNMGLREARFYADLAPKLAMRVPRVHAVDLDPSDGAFVLLLEDLETTGCTVSSGPESPSVDAAARALEDLAGLHVRFEDAATRRREAGWVAPPDPPSDYGSMRLAEGLAQHREKLTDAFAEMATLYIDERDALHAVWSAGPATVIHGDCHIGNLFFDAGRVGFLDWGMVVVSTPLRDLSYFLAMSLSVADRRAHERALIRHYLEARRALGGLSIGFDAAWLAHRLHAAYLAPASCQIVTFPPVATPRRKRFAAAFLERASAAIEDLESRAALREHARI